MTHFKRNLRFSHSLDIRGKVAASAIVGIAALLVLSLVIVTSVVLRGTFRGVAVAGSALASLAPWSSQLAAGSVVTLGGDTVGVLQTVARLPRGERVQDTVVIYRGAWRDSVTASRVLADTALRVEVAAENTGGPAHLRLVKPQSPPRNKVGELWLDQPFRSFAIESR